MKTSIIRNMGLAFLSILASAVMAGPHVVSTTADAGAGSLRAAITAANLDTAPPVDIVFNVLNVPPGTLTPTGVAIIQPLTPLPVIQNTSGNRILINGYTQPGSSYVSGFTSSLVVKVELDGSMLPPPGSAPPFAHGLHIMSSSNIVQGLCLHSFPHNGICIEGVPTGSNRNWIYWNLVGTDVTGMTAMPNGHDTGWPGSLWAGIYIIDRAGGAGIATGNHILENVVSGNAVEGVGISGVGASTNHVERCYIGIDITGAGPLGNGHDGVYLGEGTHHNAIEQNWICNNGYEGVGIVGYGPSGLSTQSNLIYNNRIGADVNLNPLGNLMHGVAIGSYGGTVYGFAPENIVELNTIAYNGLTGVAVQDDPTDPIDDDSSFNQITRNAIYFNGFADPGYLGIDLVFEPGLTPNDVGDPDLGPNQLINFPVISSATFNSPTTTVQGSLWVGAPTPVTIEIFTAWPDASGTNHGQGAIYHGNTTTSGGTWTAVLNTGPAPGNLVTATATDDLNNTSEFAFNIPVWDEDQAPNDFGDAPDQPYRTYIARNGPQHVIVPGMYLGSSVDGEPDGQPLPFAVGDDNDGYDDEDGVAFPIPLVAGQPAQIDIKASVVGRIDAWLDFNGDGDWMDAGEQILNSQNHPGAHLTWSYNFNVPASAVSGPTYARIRYSSGGGLLPTGPAAGGGHPDGEVEDQLVNIDSDLASLGDRVWDDANQNGLQEAGETGIPGVTVKLYNNGGVQVGTDTTDAAGNYLFTALAAGTYEIEVIAPAGYTISPQNQGGDDTKDSDVDAAGKTGFITLAGGTADLTWDAGMYQGIEEELDWGDAPDFAGGLNYPTLAASGGAHHVLSGLFLGAAIDAEPDGQPTSNADGDDLNILYPGVPFPPGDEDGVVIPTALISGVPATYVITTSGPGFLQGWVDWNADGDWADGGEQIITNMNILAAGTYSVTRPVPSTAGASTYARFRFSSQQTLPFSGFAPDGEVEDYPIHFEDLKWLRIPEQGKEGVDVAIDVSTPRGLADDFLCTESGKITDIHMWGSFLDDVLPSEGPGGLIIDLAIWSDVPAGADPNPDVTYSHPGDPLWQETFHPGNYNAGQIWFVPEGEWWHDPATGAWAQFADHNIYQFDFYPRDPFVQQEGTIYWLEVNYRYEGDDQFQFGWKTTPDKYNDDAVWWDPANEPVFWRDLWYLPPHPRGEEPLGPESLELAFALSGGEPDNIDWGDAPEAPQGGNYPTTSANSGASHGIAYDPTGVQYRMGAGIDGEPDGQPSGGAIGDDQNLVYPGGVSYPPGDEDGVTFTTALIPNVAAFINVNASTAGFVNAWIDLDGNGDWTAANEQIFADVPVVVGPNPLPYTVPAGSSSGLTYARFRFTSQPLSAGNDYRGPEPDGEVEDYEVMIEDAPDGVDFGDAPDPGFPTLLASSLPAGGARHLIVAGYHMGATVDSELDGQPDSTATGDDNAGVPNDEDGVYIYPLVPGLMSAMDVTLPATAASGMIDAWIDFDQDGTWGGAGEQVAFSTVVTTGVNQIKFLVPSGLGTGSTFARVRFSSAGGLFYTGQASDGEVEDQEVQLLPENDPAYDYGDAPDGPYPTLNFSGGAAHVVGTPLFLGAVAPDGEPDGQPSGNALGDDNDVVYGPPNDDEDGVSMYALINGKPTVIEIVASAPGFVDLWVDTNLNGSWNDPADLILAGHAVNSGPNYVSFTPSVAPGTSYARVRISNTGFLPPTGFAPDGEVEDYRVELYDDSEGMDFGDASDLTVSATTNFPTTMMDFGAAHLIDSLFMGLFVDTELDGQPSLGATGDDATGAPDEDGIVFVDQWISGYNARVTVTVNHPLSVVPVGEIDLWVDWNGDGTWAQANEHVLVAVPVLPGANALTIPVPVGMGPVDTYARFRLSHLGSGVTYTGYTKGGEVEDYLVPVGKVINSTISITTSPLTAVLAWTAEPMASSYSVYSSTTLLPPFPGNWTPETSGLGVFTWSEPITGTPIQFYVVVAFP